MNLLDILLLACLLSCSILGWRAGIIRASLVVVGLGVGSVLMLVLAPPVLDAVGAQPLLRALMLPLTLFLGAAAVQLALLRPVRGLHDSVEVTSLRGVNRALGSIATILSFLIFVWGAATATVLMLPAPALSAQMQGSVVLTGLDRAVGNDAGSVFIRLQGLVDASGMPRVFAGLGLVPLPEVVPASEDDLNPAVFEVAGSSVVRIFGQTNCGTGVVGSGVVVAPQRVMTNAHVVAGMTDPRVSNTSEWRGDPGRVVYFDPADDVAMLDVPDLDMAPVVLGPEPLAGDAVAIAGFPGGTELTVDAGRVRGTIRATGEDIFGEQEVRRRVFVVQGPVRPGNSGGPALDSTGRMVGLVFAATSEDGTNTGYVLTPDRVGAVLASMSDAQVTVDPKTCAPDRP